MIFIKAAAYVLNFTWEARDESIPYFTENGDLDTAIRAVGETFYQVEICNASNSSVAPVSSAAAHVAVLDGSGTVPCAGQTETGHYTITRPSQLAQLARAVNGTETGTPMSCAGSTFTLRSDLDLSAVCGGDLGSWPAIGDADARPFSGTFEGGGYTISNLSISEGEQRYCGLFGFVSGAEIKDLTLSSRLP